MKRKKLGTSHLNLGSDVEDDLGQYQSHNGYNFPMTGNGLCLLGNDTSNMKQWILLDNQSTVDIFCNSDLLMNVRRVKSNMSIETNGGVLSTNMKGYLKGYGDVWFHPKAIANILALSNVIKKYRVTYDSGRNNMFVVHKPNELVYFMQSDNGLFYHDTENKVVSFINTVEENKERFNEQQ